MFNIYAGAALSLSMGVWTLPVDIFATNQCHWSVAVRAVLCDDLPVVPVDYGLPVLLRRSCSTLIHP